MKPLLAALAVAGVAVPAMAQEGPTTGGRRAPAQLALTPEMARVSRALFGWTRAPLERYGGSFWAFGATLSQPGRVFEVGPSSAPDPKGGPAAMAESIRRNLRDNHAAEALVIGVIVDSISGPVEEAGSGALVPQPPRWAIAELEDRAGRCVRVKRSYRFVRSPGRAEGEAGGPWGFGRIAYGAERMTRCEPRHYWQGQRDRAPSHP